MNSLEKAREIFQSHEGMLRTKQVLELGIHPRTLYQLRDKGEVIELSRGLYRLNNMELLAEPDLVVVAKKIPKAIMCLITALSLHENTTQIPSQVYLAISSEQTYPIKLDYPPIKVFHFSAKSFNEGIEKIRINEVEIKVYSLSKTIVDCFKYRNKIGIDVAIEALKLGRENKKVLIKDLLYYARLCRVEKVMMPYLEAIG